jgi:hypothetical protein
MDLNSVLCFCFSIVRVRVILRLAVYRQSVRLSVKSLETHDQISFFFQLSPCGNSPYVTSSLARSCVCLLWVVIPSCTISQLTTQLMMATNPIENTVSNNSSIVAFLSVAAEACLSSRYKATDHLFWLHYSDSQVPCHNVIYVSILPQIGKNTILQQVTASLFPLNA